MREHVTLLRPDAPGPSRGPTSGLPTDLTSEAAGRLRVLALLYAFVFFMAGVFPALLFTADRTRFLTSVVQWGPAAFGIVIGLVVAALVRSPRLSLPGAMRLGVAFEIASSFAIAGSEFGDPAGLENHRGYLGLSWVAIWVVLFTVVVPTTPRRAVVAALASVSAVPVVIGLLIVSGMTTLRLEAAQYFFGLVFPYLLVVGMAYVGARVVYRLGTEVKRARELGSYSLEEKLGEGGMGEVWRARHRMLARPAAIKLIRRSLGGDGQGGVSDEALRRFEREAQVIARLRSPHTVELFDFGVAADGVFYYVMELLDGLDADSLLRRHGPMPAERAVFLLRQVCHSLSEAESCGLVHRDIKPANIVVCRYGEEYDFVKVLDFGIVGAARQAADASGLQTAENQIQGTPAFMAPEQAMGTAIDARADIYATGCLAYWLLTGHFVFSADTPMGYIMHHARSVPLPPSARTERPISAALDDLVLSCLAKQPADRPQTARELSRRLGQLGAAEAWSQERARQWWRSHQAPTIAAPSIRADGGVALALALLLAAPSPARAQSDTAAGPRVPAASDVGWPSYGGDAGGMRYSPAAQITRENVGRLKPAWTYRTGALDQKTEMVRKAAFESTPILVENRLLLTTPYDHVVALNPARGTRLWEYDPRVNLGREYSEVTSRGVSAWVDPTVRRGRPCRLRIYLGTLDGRLVALDGESGKPCADFGAAGAVNLARDAGLPADWPGGYQVTSAPAVYRDLVITGTSIADNWRVSTGRGIVRAFDARSGKLRWTWDPIPWARATTPPTGAGNAWSTLSVDGEHDLVLVPTSSPAPDYFGGLRKGDNRWGNAVVALRASTGKLVWGFQVVHHDLWDYDVAAQPTLVTWKDGTPAVVINTKMGQVFVLDRRTGKPLLPVEERPVPQTDVPGEETWPTQPFSTISLVPDRFGPEDVWGPTPADSAWCADKVKASRSEGIFTPPSLRGTVVVPGNVGGVNWGGAAYDPERGLMFANTNRLVAWVRMIPRADYDAETKKDQDNRIFGEFGNQQPAAYGLYRTFLLSPAKVPCNRPPWGATVAVDLASGKKVWEVPLGTMVPGKQTGSPNLGGPMATAGGLVFTSAAMDGVFRAFDSETGKEVWTYQLPAGGQATPMTYSLGGSQYVVIAAGGHGKLGTRQGDYVIGFTLDGRQSP